MNNIVYHYCSIEAFYSIMSNKTIRMSNIRKMNDYLEGKWLHKCIVESFDSPEFRKLYYSTFSDQLKNEYDDLLKWWEATYFPATDPELIFCVSESSDTLSQWRAYANDGKGVCIGFDTQLLKEISLYKDSPITFNKVQYMHSERISDQVLTIFNEKYQDVHKIGIQLFKSTIDTYLKHMEATFIKNPAFAEEREWRLVYNPNYKSNQSDEGRASIQIGNFSISERKFKPCDDNIVSYRELNFSKQMDIIKHIVTGPKCQINPHIDVLDFLWSIGYNTCDIQFSQSTATYR